MVGKSYSHVIRSNEICSIHSVRLELERLNERLNDTELHTLTFFNSVYLSVVKELEHAVADGLFLHPDLVSRLDMKFALYYFDALNYFIENERLPELWRQVLHKGVFTPFYFLIGANVHINHDLPLAIKESIENPEVFFQDFNRADMVVERALGKFLLTYTFTGRFIFAKRFFCSLYRRPVTWMILRWRHAAWKSACLLASQKLTRDDLVRDTVRVSQKLVWCGKLLGRILQGTAHMR